MKKILVLILAVVLVAGCIGEKPGADTGKGTDSGKTVDKVSTQENVKIDSIIFTRTGAQVNLKEEAQVTFANIYDNDTKIASQNVNSKAKEVFIDFKWEPKKQYKIEVQTSNGATSSAVYAPSKPTALKLGEIKLEEVEPGNINKVTENIKGDVKFSPDGKYLVVGTHTGYLKAIDTATNKIVFDKKFSEGRIYALDFTQDGKYLLVGEESVEGYLYALEFPSGKEIWKFRSGDDIGTDIKNKPGIRKLEIIGNTAYVVACRAASGADKTYYYSRIYAFEIDSGKVLWKFPKNDVIDLSIYQIDVSSDGKYIFFAGSSYPKGMVRDSPKYKDGVIHVLNSEGKELWSYELPVVPYQIHVWIGKGSISDNGKYVMAIDYYGAAYLFDNEEIIKTGKASPVWSKNISTAIEMSGIPIYGSLNYASFLGDNIIFNVGSTYIPSKSKSAKYNRASVEHPNGNGLLVYDLKGDLIWKWKVEGYAPGQMGTSKDSRFLVLPIGQNIVTNNLDVHGVYVFDNSVQGGATSKLAYIYKTQGIVVAAAISPDGKYIAAIESPARLDDGTVIGEYKVHMLI
jgi:WD40 repeat protein